MAYGTAVKAVTSPISNFTVTAPVSLTSNWVTIATGINSADSAGALLNPESIAATRAPILRGAGGTNLLLRVVYTATSTITTSPIVKVFGRSGNDFWDNLPSKGGNAVETITCTPATDVTDGTLCYSPINFSALAWDCLGCEKFVVAISTAIAGSAVTTAVLQAKVI